MKYTKKNHLRSPSSSECFLSIGMTFSLFMALLGAIYNEQAVWAAGLVLFALFTLQCAVVAYVNIYCTRISPDSV